MIPAVGKSGPCTNFRISASCACGIVHQRDGGVDNFGEIVRRNLGRHADGDAVGAVDQQIRNACGKNVGLDFAAVVVGAEVDGLFVEIFEQRGGDLRELGFGVAVGRRRISIDRAEIALSELPAGSACSRSAPGAPTRRRPRGCHADGTCPSLRRRCWRTCAWRGWAQAHLLHGVQNAAMHRLQSVAHVGQRAANDHRHRIVEIRPPHLVFNVDGLNVQGAGELPPSPGGGVNGSSGF